MNFQMTTVFFINDFKEMYTLFDVKMIEKDL